MKRFFERLLCMLCAALLLTAAAAEEAVFYIDADALDPSRLSDDSYVHSHLSTASGAVKVRMQVTDSEELQRSVRLTVSRSDTQALIYDKFYGLHSGRFSSDTVYLPYSEGAMTPYLVTLQVDDIRYVMPLLQINPMLTAQP